MMTPQQQLQQVERDPNRNRELLSACQTFIPTTSPSLEQLANPQNDGSNIKFEQKHQASPERPHHPYREPPKSATFPPKRDWLGREGDRGNSERPHFQYPLRATFSNIHKSLTPTQRAQDKLDRLAAEASSVVEEISYSSLGIKGTSESLVDSRPASTSPVAVNADQQPRLQQLVTVPEHYSHSHSYSNSSTTLSTPTSATSMSSNFVRTLPRTSSIDSTLSNSSQTHGHLQPQSSGSPPQDVASLILASGSPEAVIQGLLKDKASAQAQNAQLWRLVEKQRSMILGLNKDLERALKDKERYRKKLKENLAMFPHIQSDRAATESPAPSEQTESHSPHEATAPNHGLSTHMERDRNGSIGLDVEPYPVTPSRAHGDFDDSSLDAPVKIPAFTTHTKPIQPTRSDLRTTTITTDGKNLSSEQDFPAEQKSRREVVMLNIDTNDRLPNEPSAQDTTHLTHPLSATSDNITPISITPISAISPVLAERVALKKKGPPTRLDLSPTERMPFQATRGNDNDESNYDDDDDDDDDEDDGGGGDNDEDENVSIDEVSGYGECRKELGEAVGSKDETSENAGKVERQTTSHSGLKQTEIGDTPREYLFSAQLAGPTKTDAIIYESAGDGKVGISEPLALKALGPRPAPLSLSRLREAYDPGSLGLSPMFPPGHRDNIVTTRLNSPHPMSPGLPSSPRPSANTSFPRPKKNGTYPEPLTLRIAPKTPGLCLPASPRVGLTPAPFHSHGSSTPSQATFAAATSSLGLLPLSPNPYSHESSSRHAPGSVSSPVAELLIEPSSISTFEIRVVSSRLRPSRASFLPGKMKGADDSVFTLGVFSRITGKENWRVEKDIGALPALDSRLRQYNRDLNAKLPDKSLFTGHAPAKVDARRMAIEDYFNAVMDSHMDDQTTQILCEFFSADVEFPFTEPQPPSGDQHSPDGLLHGKVSKEGYLTKRGKNFGGWKARYFILDGPILRYFECPGGTHLGSIKLVGAQIGRQQQQKESHSPKEVDAGDSETENQFRHAFLIMEPKRKDSGSLVRHVLCAESDTERDEWVDALMQWVKGSEDLKLHKSDSLNSLGKEGKKKKEKKDKESVEKAEDELRAYRYDDVVPGAAPARGPTPDGPRYRSPTPTSNSNNSAACLNQSSSQISIHSATPLIERAPSSKLISGPTHGEVIADASAWGNQTDRQKNQKHDKDHKEAKALRKRSIWGFRGRSSSDLSNDQKPESNNRIPPGRMVFGVSLEEAIAVSRPFGVTAPLPAVVYRCIEYLDAKNAVHEEGIFRLNGSNVVIKGLRDRFNSGECMHSRTCCAFKTYACHRI